MDNDRFSLTLLELPTIELLKKINDCLKLGQGKLYVVGGFIRDALVGRETVDIDLAVIGDALDIARRLSEQLNGTYVLLDSDNGIGRVVLASGITRETSYIIDVSTIAGTLENDLSRRDFTINALAFDLYQITEGHGSARLIDMYHGRDDLDRGIIRSIDKKNLEADPLRILRAVRLSVELGFVIEQKTGKQISSSAALLGRVAGERIREELVRLFSFSRGGQFLFELDKYGLLDILVPEFGSTRGVEQPVEHHWDVFTHSVMTVSAVDYLLRQGVWEYAKSVILREALWSDDMARYFEKPVAGGTNRRVLLKIAALLHDIAKPQTRAIENGRMRFLGHSEQGSEIVINILERLRFSTRETKMIADMVKYHLRPTQMGQLPSHRAVYRYFRDVGDVAVDVLFLSMADHLATRGPHLIPANWSEHTDTVKHILDEHYKQEKNILPSGLINGNDIMEIFGLRPGPRVGELLSIIKEAQATGELTTRQQALQYIHNVLTEGKR